MLSELNRLKIFSLLIEIQTILITNYVVILDTEGLSSWNKITLNLNLIVSAQFQRLWNLVRISDKLISFTILFIERKNGFFGVLRLSSSNCDEIDSNAFYSFFQIYSSVYSHSSCTSQPISVFKLNKINIYRPTKDTTMIDQTYHSDNRHKQFSIIHPVDFSNPTKSSQWDLPTYLN